MLRTLILTILLLSLGVTWFAQFPGVVRYTWHGIDGEISATKAAALLALGVVVVLVAGEGLRLLWQWPSRLRARRRSRKTAQAWATFGDGLVALGGGDAKTAGRAAARSLRALPDRALATFFAAQTAQLNGDGEAARRHFGTLAAADPTAIVGEHGLAIEAIRSGDHVAALSHARAALARDPQLGWAAHMVFEAAAASGDTAFALAQLARNQKAGLVDTRAANRLRAVLLTAQALSGQSEDRGSSRDMALEAHRLAKDFVPAALAASAAVASRNKRQAATILEETYKRAPHPDLFRAALDLEGQAADVRLKRAKSFAAIQPQHLESALGLARAALSARELDAAREAIHPFLDSSAPQRVCILMAELEAMAPGDEGRVRDWLARAVRAPHDPVWMADGVMAAAWAPVSPVTGRLDAFTWQVPPTLGTPPVPAIDLPPMPSRITAGPDPSVPTITDESEGDQGPSTSNPPPLPDEGAPR
ncbi:MAG: heme biosynthesis HemY N-terminal domain-containing protein [Pseudomonadota bacterium]